MSNAQAERAINQLYESDTVRSELRDEEASLLLRWGESRLAELADQNLPDDSFDDLSAKLRSLLVAVNYCVGKRKTMPSQHLSMMAEIISTAEAAGYKLLPEGETGFLKHQAVLSNDEAIAELLGLLKPVAVPQARTLPQVEAQAVELEASAAPIAEADLPLPDFHVPVVSDHPPIVEPVIAGLVPTDTPAAAEPPPESSFVADLPNTPTAEPGAVITASLSSAVPNVTVPAQSTDQSDMTDQTSEVIVPPPDVETSDLATPPQPEYQPATTEQPSAVPAEPSEVIVPPPDADTSDPTAPPQPEDLPEFPMQPPQEN